MRFVKEGRDIVKGGEILSRGVGALLRPPLNEALITTLRPHLLYRVSSTIHQVNYSKLQGLWAFAVARLQYRSVIFLPCQ